MCWAKENESMMRKVATILVITLTMCLSGCTGGNSLIVTQADFDKVTNSIFSSPEFTRRGGGLAGGGDEMEFSAVYEPKDATAKLLFDFGAWDAFLNGKDKFSGRGKGGSQGLYWRQTWDNRNRFIVIDAVAMKNGNVRVTYREILR